MPNEILNHIFNFIHNDLINLKLTCVLWDSLIIRNNKIKLNSIHDMSKQILRTDEFIEINYQQNLSLKYPTTDMKYISKHNNYICNYLTDLLLLDIYGNIIKKVKCDYNIVDFYYDDAFYILTKDNSLHIHKYENNEFNKVFTKKLLSNNFYVINEYYILRDGWKYRIFKDNKIYDTLNCFKFIILNNIIVQMRTDHLILYNIYDKFTKTITIKKYIPKSKTNVINFLGIVNGKSQFYFGNYEYIILFDF